MRSVIRKKKAQVSSFSIFTWMIIAFLAVVFFAGLIWIMGQLNDVFHSVGVMNDQTAHPNITFPCIDNASNTCGGTYYTNMTQASDEIWGSAYQSIQALRMVAAVYILAEAASIIIVGFLQKKHPFLFFVYVLIVLLAVIFAPSISNSYLNLLNSGIFDNGLSQFTASNYIILNLPVMVLIIGILGGIGLFINLVRPDSSGEITARGNY